MTTQRPDHYATLGVPSHATQIEIGRAYRSLLRRHHPDTRARTDQAHSSDADAALQQVLAAYTVLRDPAQRADYDRGLRHRSRPTPHPATDTYHAYRRPPIVAGPVRWHRT